MELKRVVVTGLGAVTPLGNNPEETWKAMLEGKSGAAPITYFDTTNFKTKFACEVKGLNINDYIDRKEARKLDRYTQLALISAIQGVEDCGIDLDKVNKNRIGVVYGVGIGGIKTFEEEISYYALHKEAGPKFNPFFIPKMIADIASGHISIRFGFHGPNFTTTSACASSTKSMTGHLLGAAGAVEAMACVLSIQNNIVPPTINHNEEDKDEEIDYNLNFTFNKAEKREVRAALSNTFGFGGHNACVIFKKYAE